jgi:hypothetical protein
VLKFFAATYLLTWSCFFAARSAEGGAARGLLLFLGIFAPAGWRGYALPRLAERFGLGGASVVLGVLWATWHLPLFFFPGADTENQSFPVYLLESPCSGCAPVISCCGCARPRRRDDPALIRNLQPRFDVVINREDREAVLFMLQFSIHIPEGSFNDADQDGQGIVEPACSRN